MTPAQKKHGIAFAYIVLFYFLVNTTIHRATLDAAEASGTSKICLDACALEERGGTDYKFKAQQLAKCHSRCLRNILTASDTEY